MGVQKIQMPTAMVDHIKVYSAEGVASLSRHARAQMLLKLRSRVWRERSGFLQEEDYLAIAALIGAGLRYRDIGARFGRSSSHIARLAMNFGLARGKSGQWRYAYERAAP